MPSKPKELSGLHRDLLQSAFRAPKGTIWLPKEAAHSFPTTYAALMSLQRRKLMEPEQAKDPEVVSWTITKEGREVVAPPKASGASRDKAMPAPEAHRPSASPEMAPATATGSRAAPPSTVATPRNRTPKGGEAASPAKPSLVTPLVKPSAVKSSPARSSPVKSVRSAPASDVEKPSRERGSKGKEAVPAAKPPVRSSAKKPLSSPKKSGGRGRT